MFLINYFMFVFTLANGFLIGNWKVYLSNYNEKCILHDETIIKINNDFVIVENNNNGGELVGNYKVNDTAIIINNVKISKIPSITKLPKAMANYKWIKYIQENGLTIKINSFNDTTLQINYECNTYTGDIKLKKID